MNKYKLAFLIKLAMVASLMLTSYISKAGIYIVHSYESDSAIVENAITERVEGVSINTTIRVTEAFIQINNHSYEVERIKTFSNNDKRYVATDEHGNKSIIQVRESDGFIIHSVGDYIIYYSLTLPKPQSEIVTTR